MPFIQHLAFLFYVLVFGFTFCVALLVESRARAMGLQSRRSIAFFLFSFDFWFGVLLLSAYLRLNLPTDFYAMHLVFAIVQSLAEAGFIFWIMYMFHSLLEPPRKALRNGVAATLIGLHFALSTILTFLISQWLDMFIAARASHHDIAFFILKNSISLLSLIYGGLIIFIYYPKAAAESRKILKGLGICTLLFTPGIIFDMFVSSWNLMIFLPLYVSAIAFLSLRDSLKKPVILNQELGKVPILDNFGLSIREKEVLALILKGCSNAQIASELFISAATVKVHVGNIFKKTTSRNRHDLIVRFLQSEIRPKY